jgi:hypothetical protein
MTISGKNGAMAAAKIDQAIWLPKIPFVGSLLCLDALSQ